MAFTSNVTYQNVVGNERELRGTYTNTGGSTGGDIRTGLGEVRSLTLQPKGAAVSADASVVNETFPLVNQYGDVTIVTPADEDGEWIAKGI